MRTWNYNQDIKHFINILEEICNDGKEFHLIVPKKFNTLFETLQNYNNETDNLYNINFIEADIDYIIIENLDVIKIENYKINNTFVLYYIDFLKRIIYNANGEEIYFKSLNEFEESYEEDNLIIYDPNGNKIDIDEFHNLMDITDDDDLIEILLPGKYRFDIVINH